MGTKTAEYTYNEDNFVEENESLRELTVTITLGEYRNLIEERIYNEKAIETLQEKNEALNKQISSLSNELCECKQPMPEWISVKDKLPPPFESVLVCTPGESPLPFWHEGFITDKTQEWYVCSFYREFNEVTHWMPMPDPPEEFKETLCERIVDNG